MQITIPPRETATTAQIQNLLQVAGVSLSALGHFMGVPEGENRLAGETRIAAETTFIKTLQRLDQIVEDDKRWSSDFQAQVEKDYQEAHEAQLAFSEAQRLAATEIASAHSRYRPVLARLKSGGWIAYLGELDSENLIAGVGGCAQAALEAFDSSFTGKELPAFMQEWLKTRETDLDNGKELKPFPAELSNETMDQTGDRNPEKVQGGGQDQQANSGPVGPN